MKKEVIVCDKCKAEINGKGSETKVSDGIYDFAVSPIDLCITCTKDFINWLEGEPIPKQTTLKSNINPKEPNHD